MQKKIIYNIKWQLTNDNEMNNLLIFYEKVKSYFHA